MKRLITDKVLHILVENLSFSDYILVTKDISDLEVEIERLNKENEELKKIQCTFLGTGCKAEIERLNNIIKRLEEDLKEMYLTFGEFSEEYTENRIKELKGSENKQQLIDNQANEIIKIKEENEHLLG